MQNLEMTYNEMQCNHETLWTRKARTRRSHCHRYDTLTFDNISAMAAKKWTKNCAALSEFLFCSLNLLHFRFSRFRRRWRKSSSFLVAQARKTILDMRRFCWKNRPFDEKRATKKTSTVTSKEAPIILNVKTTHSFKTNDHFRTGRPCFSCKATKQEKTGHKDKFILLISTRLLPRLYYYMRNFCTLIGLEQWYFSLIWNT